MGAELFRFQAREETVVDTSRILVLRQSLGDQRCREVVEEVVYHLTDRLGLLQKALDEGERAEAERLSERLASLSEQVGLTDFARAARHLGECVKVADPVATAAVAARLIRLSEDSLFSVMLHADQSAL